MLQTTPVAHRRSGQIDRFGHGQDIDRTSQQIRPHVRSPALIKYLDLNCILLSLVKMASNTKCKSSI
jgi:hypothetical protein